MSQDVIKKAQQHFGELLKSQLERIEKMKNAGSWIDYKKLDTIIIGICPGDGIGIEISRHAKTILEFLLKQEVKKGKIKFNYITGLTIENRAKHKKAIPDDALAEFKKCHVILKGPTTTPQAGDKWPNIESANVAIRRELDLFANVRPVKIPDQGIDWCFFRENTEGSYALGSRGIDVTDDLSVDFTVATQEGCERIIKMAFEF